MNFQTRLEAVRLTTFFFLCLWAFSPASGWAAGAIHGAKGAGMGTAFVAIADDPSAIVVNPAGLTRSRGTNVYGGLTAVSLETTYTSPSGQEEKTLSQVFFPPNLFIATDAGWEDVVIGLGFFSPLGIGGRKWSETGLTRYISTRSDIGTFSIQPTLAWQVVPSLSVGGGPYYLYALSKSEAMVDQSALGAGDGKVVMEADGDTWGYSVGILWDMHEMASLGLAYRSKAKVNFSGDTTISNISPALQPAFGGAIFRTAVNSTMTFPEIISVGMAFKPLRNLVLGIDGDLVRWSRLDRSALHFRTQVPEAGFTDTTAVFDWNDAWIFKVGLDYRMSEALSLRAGYNYADTQVPDRTLGPDSPETKQHYVAVGFGWRIGTVTIDSFYEMGIPTERTVSNEVLSGTYRNRNHSIGLNIGKSF